MASSYAEAIAILKAVGREFSGRNCRTEAIPLVSAVGRIVARNYASPESTPGFDSSAMDGYAIHSAATANASFEKPVTFRVMGTAAAGDPLVTISSNRDENGTEPCVEIMTGSRFPTASEGEQSFDAVVKVEDVFPVTFPATAASARYIQVVKPVHPNANKRFAGSDFQNGDAIIHQTQVIRPHHVMALASVGFTEVEVLSKPKVGLWSTGEELLPTSGDAAIQSHIRDVNGPFLQATLNECGIDVDFLGVIEDSASALRKALEKHLTLGSYDLLITSGAVSKGKFDFVPGTIVSLGAHIRFHGIPMRPGHPVLFATVPRARPRQDSTDWRCEGSDGVREKELASIPTEPGNAAFFGLPGNPIASAACLRFLVMPFLRFMQQQPVEPAVLARLEAPSSRKQANGVAVDAHQRKHSCLHHLDLFRHGTLFKESQCEWAVRLNEEQSPAKVKPFAAANCWVHIPRGYTGDGGEAMVECYSL